MKSVAIENIYKNNDTKLDIEWNLNKRCNFDCSYCSKYTHDNTSEWKTLEEYKEVVDKLVDCSKREVWLSLTGGEPALFPQFIELLQHCRDRGVYHIAICSNGSLKTETYLKIMDHINHLVMSCHFEYKVNVLEKILAIYDYIKDKPNKNMHAHVMMLPGYFEPALEIIDTLGEKGINWAARRIRPLYMPDGKVARPFQRGGELKLTASGPDHSDDQDYYSEKELRYLLEGVYE